MPLPYIPAGLDNFRDKLLGQLSNMFRANAGILPNQTISSAILQRAQPQHMWKAFMKSPDPMIGGPLGMANIERATPEMVHKGLVENKWGGIFHDPATGQVHITDSPELERGWADVKPIKPGTSKALKLLKQLPQEELDHIWRHYAGPGEE